MVGHEALRPVGSAYIQPVAGLKDSVHNYSEWEKWARRRGEGAAHVVKTGRRGENLWDKENVNKKVIEIEERNGEQLFQYS